MWFKETRDTYLGGGGGLAKAISEFILCIERSHATDCGIVRVQKCQDMTHLKVGSVVVEALCRKPEGRGFDSL
jgi:hypothetical protein